jgi:hypothetical protein
MWSKPSIEYLRRSAMLPVINLGDSCFFCKSAVAEASL